MLAIAHEAARHRAAAPSRAKKIYLVIAANAAEKKGSVYLNSPDSTTKLSSIVVLPESVAFRTHAAAKNRATVATTPESVYKAALTPLFLIFGSKTSHAIETAHTSAAREVNRI